MNLTRFPSIITDEGMIELGNLVEEYGLNVDLSLEKITRLQTLLLTYYMQTGNLIHKDIFEEIKRKFQKFPNGNSPYVSKSIEFLFSFGCIEKNPEYIFMRKKK